MNASNVEYVYAGYGISAAVFGLYVWWMLRRGRRLSKQVPPQDRRWM